MVEAAKEAAKLSFRVEILSNCYWATCPEDAAKWLFPVTKIKNIELSLSSDPYHGENWITEEVRNAVKAANALNIKVGIISVKCLDAKKPCPKNVEGAKVGLWELMYRGRASLKLADKAAKKPWQECTKCPYEDFVHQERVHVDPFGYVHVCQGITIGNAWLKPFSKLLKNTICIKIQFLSL
jgi:hypothetical protein